MFFSARSIIPTYVRWTPTREAKASCDNPNFARSARTFWPNLSKTLFFIDIHKYSELLTLVLHTIVSIYPSPCRHSFSKILPPRKKKKHESGTGRGASQEFESGIFEMGS